MAQALLEPYIWTDVHLQRPPGLEVQGGGLALAPQIKPEVAAQLREAGDEVPDESTPFMLGLPPGPGDR